MEVAARNRAAELGIVVHHEDPELSVTLAALDTVAEPGVAIDRPHGQDKSAGVLPFDIVLDHDFFKLKRNGYRTPITLNEAEWNLLQSLCKFFPGTVPKNERSRLFSNDRSARDNTPKRLREKLITVGLTVDDFTLKSK